MSEELIDDIVKVPWSRNVVHKGLKAALAQTRREALEDAEDACNSRYKLSGRVEALACAAAIRALIEKESSDE